MSSYQEVQKGHQVHQISPATWRYSTCPAEHVFKFVCCLFAMKPASSSKPASIVDSPVEPARAPQVAAFFDTATLRGKAAAAAGGLQRTPALLSVAGRCHNVQARIILGFLLGYVRFQGL